MLIKERLCSFIEINNRITARGSVNFMLQNSQALQRINVTQSIWVGRHGSHCLSIVHGLARHLFWLPVTVDIFHGAPSSGCRLVISYNGSVPKNSCLPLFPGRDEKTPLLSQAVSTLTITECVINSFALIRPHISFSKTVSSTLLQNVFHFVFLGKLLPGGQEAKLVPWLENKPGLSQKVSAFNNLSKLLPCLQATNSLVFRKECGWNQLGT